MLLFLIALIYHRLVWRKEKGSSMSTIIPLKEISIIEETPRELPVDIRAGFTGDLFGV